MYTERLYNIYETTNVLGRINEFFDRRHPSYVVYILTTYTSNTSNTKSVHKLVSRDVLFYGIYYIIISLL